MARLMIFAASLLPTLAFALGPKDPFTPPARTSAASATQVGVAVQRTGLSGVRLGKTPAALIDGEWITLGDTVRGARLAAVRLHEVVLQHADGRIERIAMFPEPASPAASAPATERLIVKRELP